MSSKETLLIGVDGGATEVKAHAVACADLDRAASFTLRPESAARVYPRDAAFEPLPVSEQIEQRDSAPIELTPREEQEGQRWVAAAAEAVTSVARSCGCRRVLVGIGMPGLKTLDGRGINVINNGPRIPRYLAMLEQALATAAVELAAPIAVLGSDADYCGLGEQYAADGSFRDVEHAYYVGCGTGVADALKLRGRLVPFDAARAWIQKSWQMPSALGPTFEKLVSAKSLNEVYVRLRPALERRNAEAPTASELEARARAPRSAGSESLACAAGSVYPETAAAAGEPVAVAWLNTAALVLAELIFERIWTIKNGRADAPHRGAAYGALNSDHAYRGTLLERVVIGQRVGQIYADPAFRAVFRAKLDTQLAALLDKCGDTQLADEYLERGDSTPGSATLKPGFVQASQLRAAPALGAAVAAVHAWRGT
ncbi:MAG: hypothetical protein KKB50_08390 [Planctomycetes bacterium]|nr:hypothetical protein [Planctomycetota bacterium]